MRTREPTLNPIPTDPLAYGVIRAVRHTACLLGGQGPVPVRHPTVISQPDNKSTIRTYRRHLRARLGWGPHGPPCENDRRCIVDAIFYVSATGCQWRALPAEYPNWNTCHRYHLTWSRDGTWATVARRLTAAARQLEGRDPESSGGVIDARTARGAATVTSETRGYDGGKKISGRKAFGIVDTLGLLIAVIVLAANVSDNTGGIEVVGRARKRSVRLTKVWHDGGFKNEFIGFCRRHHISAEVVNKIHAHRFEVLPKRWVVERTWSWGMNNRRLQVDYERDPKVTEGFIWAAKNRLLLGRICEPAAPWPTSPNSRDSLSDFLTFDLTSQV
jgi:transposase